MNIFKTFETFLTAPLSVIKNNFIRIVSIDTGNIFKNKPSVDVSIMKDCAQITVVNNEKLYNLLSLVAHKKSLKTPEEKVHETT